MSSGSYSYRGQLQKMEELLSPKFGKTTVLAKMDPTGKVEHTTIEHKILQFNNLAYPQ